MRLLLSLILFCSFLSVTASAQHEHPTPTTGPVVPSSGLGGHHHPVTTANTEAQRFFDQGLTLVYAFNHEEAAKYFKRAADLDPDLAMAFWGIALAVGPNYNEPAIDPERLKAAVEAINKAKSLLGRVAKGERDYILALEKRFSLDPKADPKNLYRDYKNAMGELFRRYPDDLDAATLYADSLMNLKPWQLWTKQGEPAEGTLEIVEVLEGVLKRDPEHIGANHLYIHAVEASRHPERALPSAKRLETAAPAAGHLVHMPGHIYLRVGDYEATARSNEAAAEADRAYLRGTGAKGMYPAMYYSHNLHFLVESYGRMGRYQEALRSAERLSENVREHVKAMPMVEGFLPSALFVRLRFGRWDEVLKFPEPDRDFLVTHAVWHYSRGVAYAVLGRPRDAENERKAFLQATQNLPGETPFGLNSAASVFKIAENVLDARIMWARGDKTGSLASWRRALSAEDLLNYDEPPGWYYPVRESLGAALLLSGDPSGAESTFREDLNANPRNGRSLFGLIESLKQQGKTDAALLVQREFDRAWKDADSSPKLEDF